MTVGNPYFKIFNIFDKFITNNIIDINSIRANKSTPKERRWIYPGYPEKNDENYPRIAIKFGTPSFEDVGANNFIEETIDNSTIIKSNYGFLMNTKVTLFIFIKKDQVHNVAYYDGTKHPTKNKKQSDFLTWNISKTFDGIIANPPYLKHHNFHYRNGNIFAEIGRRNNIKLSRLTNLYVLFILEIW